MATNCAKCGQELEATANYCGHCGAVVAAKPFGSHSSFTPPTFNKPTFTPPPVPGAHGARARTPAAAPQSPGAVPTPGSRATALFERGKRIVLKPKDEWPVIAREPTTSAQVFLGYVLPLAAIGVLAIFIGSTLIGIDAGFLGTVRTRAAPAMVAAVLQLALTLGGVLVLARVVNHLAPMFGGERNGRSALKLVAYSLTPAFVGAALMVTPAFDGIATLLGLYGAYLMFVGLPVLMGNKPEQTIGYAGVTLLAALVGVAAVATATTWLARALTGV